MKKILIRVLLGIVALFALLIGGVLLFVYGLRPKTSPPLTTEAPRDEATIARGAYLANNVALCAFCHSPYEDAAAGTAPAALRFTGHEFSREAEFAEFGTFVATNLTSSNEHGIGQWKDGEIVRAIREGVSRDNRALFPMMPYKHFGQTLSNADAMAIAAYLKSLPAAGAALPKTKLAFPFSAIARVSAEPAADVQTPAPSAGDAYGDWLVKATLCSSCHDTMDGHDPVPGKEFAGGQKFPIKAGTVVAPNITGDPVTGIGSYSVEDIVRVLDGTMKNGSAVRFMPSGYYKDMTAADKLALAQAVKRIKPVTNAVAR